MNAGARIGALLLFVSVAGAQELRTPGEEVLEEIAAARALPDEIAWAQALAEAAEIYRFPADEVEAKRLYEVVLESLRSNTDEVLVAALHALARMRVAGSARSIEPFLRDLTPHPDQVPRVVAALAAAGSIRSPILVEPLLRIVRKGANLTVATEAWKALAQYGGTEPALRKKVVTAALDAASFLVRGTTRARKARRRTLRGPALRALQLLVGRRLNTVEQFQEWWKVAKTLPDPFPIDPDQRTR